jgi:hypothetical protein
MKMRPEPENRWWILDPAGHRRIENGHKDQFKDGQMIDTVFGEAVLIIPPAPPAEDWYCDICSEPILTKWGRQPWPVAMMSSYALCLEHYNEMKTRPHYDRDTDEPIPGTRLGEWPTMACRCGACAGQITLIMAEWN